MIQPVRDLRIRQSRPLITPAVLASELPVSATDAERVHTSRRTIAAILGGQDPRLLAIVGPCSIHDVKAALDYAGQLQQLAGTLDDALFIVMRVYFEKPRTTIGWKGLINDPELDGSFHINKGLRLARRLLLDITGLGLPVASEFLDTTFGQYYAELVSFGSIGARTVESQIHRELASGLSMPVGIKNRTDGDIDVAVDALVAAGSPHWFPSLTPEGTPAILATSGNDDICLILRGGKDSGPNYHQEAVRTAGEKLGYAGLRQSLVIDCSHGNSMGDPANQNRVLDAVGTQVAAGDSPIRGVMLESNLLAGRQPAGPKEGLVYGQSITDGCLSLEETVKSLRSLAESVRSGLK